MTGLKLIENFYRDKRASRTQIPLINHIYEGIEILDTINASALSKEAYCIHPMLQDDSALLENINYCMDNVTFNVVHLALKYRVAANAFLCRKQTDKYEINGLTNLMKPLELFSNQDLKNMLIADKIQNRKDFLLYHYGTHERSEELKVYFDKWLLLLDVNKLELPDSFKIKYML